MTDAVRKRVKRALLLLMVDVSVLSGEMEGTEVEGFLMAALDSLNDAFKIVEEAEKK